MKPFFFALRMARRYTRHLRITVVSMILLVAVQLAAPLIIKRMLEIVTDPHAGPEVMNKVFFLALIALGIYMARGVLSFLRSYVAHIAGWGVVMDVRLSLIHISEPTRLGM